MEESILKRNCLRNYYHTFGLASNSQARYLVVGQMEHISPTMFHDQVIVFLTNIIPMTLPKTMVIIQNGSVVLLVRNTRAAK